MLRSVSLLFLLCLYSQSAYSSADVLDRKLTLKMKQESIANILKKIESTAGVHFSYTEKILPKGKFNLNVRNEELKLVLLKLLSPHKLDFSVLYGNHIVIEKIPQKETVVVSGYVSDKKSGEKLIGVVIYNDHNLSNTKSNQDGYYSLSIRPDSVRLVFSTFPYQKKLLSLYISKDTLINIELKETEFMQAPFSITSSPDQQLHYIPDLVHLNKPLLSKFPMLFGETDVLKGLQLLPGVSAGSDGTIGLNVRGGGPDQNLILLDDVPLYNPSHIYGFFSVFNSDVIKDVTLIKGGMSSKYTGRLSSVVDVRTIDGNTKSLKAQASIGLLSSKLSLDGPLGKKKKTTFVLSARRSYFDLFYGLSTNANIRQYTPLRSGYLFYDANGKIKHEFSNRHQLSFSFYTGRDILFIKNSFSLKAPQETIKEKDEQRVFWGNRIYSLRDHHVITPKLTGVFNFSFTNYNFGNNSLYELQQSTDSVSYYNSFNYKFESIINNTILNYRTDWKLSNKFQLKSGIQFVMHNFERKISSTVVQVRNNAGDSNINRVMQWQAYTEADWQLQRNTSLTLGLTADQYRISNKNMLFPQLRANMNHQAFKWLKLHIGVQNTVQFLHLLTNANTGIPLDLWLPSTNKIQPETSNMISGGINLIGKNLILNIEYFNKSLNGLIEYKDQANYIGSTGNWEDKVTVGSGNSHGYEVLLEKRNGKFTGWMSYTWSINNRVFPGINGGKTFPYKYDRRHNLALFGNYLFKKGIDASFNWLFSSGARYTLPEQVYYVNSGTGTEIIHIYGERNKYQFPFYHRLDVNVNFRKVNAKYSRVLSLGAYNVYNRLNPFYITPSFNSSGERIFEAVSLFPFLPSINYKWIF